MKPVFRWTVGNCTDQGIEILCESVRSAIEIYENEFKWHILYNNLTPKQLSKVAAVAESFGVIMRRQHSRDLPIPQKSMGGPHSSSGKFDCDGSKVGGTLWKICPGRIVHDTHEIVMDNDIVLTGRVPEIDKFLGSSKLLILQDNVKFYGKFASFVHSDVPLNTGLIGLPPDYYFSDEINELYYAYRETQSSPDYTNLSQADEQGMLASVISKKDHIVISNEVVVELLGRTAGAKKLDRNYFAAPPLTSNISGRGDDDSSVGKHLTSYRRFCESIFSPDRKGYHFCQSNRIESHFAWELYKNFQEHGAGILSSFGNKEAERIAHRGYVEGCLGSRGLAKNWAETYAERRLAMAKSELDR